MPRPDRPARTLQSRVPPRAAGTALLAYLCARFPYRDEAAWAEAIAHGLITVNGRGVSPSQRLARGDLVAFTGAGSEPAVPTDVAILHEDGHILVVDKPAGLPCHGDGAFRAHTLIALLARRDGPEPRLVHRLDRETGGVMVVARTRAAGRALTAQFARGTVEKTYLAVVEGVPSWQDLAYDAPIGRHPTSEVSIRRAVVAADAEGAQPAFTRFVLRRSLGTDTALVEAHPRTGRAHQIRVHLEHLGHPLVHDKLYGRSDRDFVAWVHAVKAGSPPGPPHRLLAWRLAFDHPSTGRRVEVEAQRPFP